MPEKVGNVLGSVSVFRSGVGGIANRRTTLFIQSIFIYTAHKVNVVVVSTNGEYGQRYWVDLRLERRLYRVYRIS